VVTTLNDFKQAQVNNEQMNMPLMMHITAMDVILIIIIKLFILQL